MLETKLVNAPVEAAVPPIAPGEAHVPLLRYCEFNPLTIVEEAKVKGAVPFATVEAITPLVAMLDAGVVEPIAPGAAKVAPFKKLEFKFATTVVDATLNGAVPVACVEVITPLTAKLVAGVPPPIEPGELKVLPPMLEALIFVKLDPSTTGSLAADK